MQYHGQIYPYFSFTRFFFPTLTFFVLSFLYFSLLSLHYVSIFLFPVSCEGRSISSRTVLLSKQTVTAENQYYYEVVLLLLYITSHGLIFDVTL